jgi:hypothetical protein
MENFEIYWNPMIRAIVIEKIINGQTIRMRRDIPETIGL